MSFRSNYISPAAVRGLSRIGDIICPGDGEFPSYSKLGCVEHADIMLEHAPPADIKDLGMLLAILSYMPNSVLRWAVKQMAESHESESALSTTFRQLDFGLRGIIFGTYYSGRSGKDYDGPDTHALVGFSINRIED
ncbi:MAG: hypothetical protein K9J06_13105 [Flavobacteriales bacterium]|nr:hypothetical protein [Flavobacteriales bacterium]